MKVFYESLARHSTVAYLFQLLLGDFRICASASSRVIRLITTGLRLEPEHPIPNLVIVGAHLSACLLPVRLSLVGLPSACPSVTRQPALYLPVYHLLACLLLVSLSPLCRPDWLAYPIACASFSPPHTPFPFVALVP